MKKKRYILSLVLIIVAICLVFVQFYTERNVRVDGGSVLPESDGVVRVEGNKTYYIFMELEDDEFPVSTYVTLNQTIQLTVNDEMDRSFILNTVVTDVSNHHYSQEVHSIDRAFLKMNTGSKSYVYTLELPDEGHYFIYTSVDGTYLRSLSIGEVGYFSLYFPIIMTVLCLAFSIFNYVNYTLMKKKDVITSSIDSGNDREDAEAQMTLNTIKRKMD